jgi:polygalacturonase
MAPRCKTGFHGPFPLIMKSTFSHSRSLSVFPRIALLALLACTASASAQLATGDGRGTVPEPTFPAVCSQLQADLTIAAGEPSSELNTATDTSKIQAALSACTSGHAVELVASGANTAFVIAPIYIPAGVTLLVDGGVTVFGSRNPTDYQIGTPTTSSTCGTIDTGGASCYPLINLGQSSLAGASTYSGTAVSGIMGYGIINGRGGDKLISISGTTVTPQSSSWWDLASQASGSNTQDVPILVNIYKVATAQLYKISLINSPHFHVKVAGQGSTTASKTTNFTVWGLKLITPFSARNTDGIDPTGVVNMSVVNSVLGDGDDESAISGSSLSANFTYSNLLLTSGHGISIGSITKNSVTNVLVQNANFSGQSNDGNQIALRIKSYCGNGGSVSQVTYQNVCIQNTYTAIDLDPYYSAPSATTSCPAFGTVAAPITYQNITILPNGTSSTPSGINLQGLSYSGTTNLSNIALSNIYQNTSTLNLKANQSADTTATPGYDTIALTGSYYPSGFGTLNTAPNATSVTETNNATLASAFPASNCTNAFPTLLGELFASTTTGGTTTNNLNKTAALTIPASITLNAMVQPTNSQVTFTGQGTYTGVPAPTASVQFFDGTTAVGTATLGSNGTLASITLANPTAGVHTYTAQYLGDATYPAAVLGANTTGTQAQSLTVTVTAGPAAQLAFTAAPATPVVYATTPGTVTVAVEDAAGDPTASTASVTLTVTGPNSYTATYTVAAVNGTATFSSLANPPSVGTFTYTATSGSFTAATVNESVTPATLTVTAQPATRIFGDPNPAFSDLITGYQNGDTASVITGSPALTTTAVRNSPATAYPILVDVTALSAANYTFAGVGSTLTINGNAPQQVLFLPLPSFASGNTYQLTAATTSGLPVTYTVSGAATISGSALTVTGPGPVTVTASSAATTNYAAAPAVQQSFTAQ